MCPGPPPGCDEETGFHCFLLYSTQRRLGARGGQGEGQGSVAEAYRFQQFLYECRLLRSEVCHLISKAILQSQRSQSHGIYLRTFSFVSE